MTQATPAGARMTRTRNLDAINQQTKTKSLLHVPVENESLVHMGIADATIIYSMLSDLSADRGAYVLREAWSNAYDATMATHDATRPISIRLPKIPDETSLATQIESSSPMMDNLVVEDHGVGMTREEVCQYFLQYGGSNKRDDVEAVGSKGLGSKAPLAVADNFLVETTRDGVTTTATIRRAAGEAGVAEVFSERTDLPSGTRLTVPVSDPIVATQMAQFAKSMATHVIDVPLVIDDKSCEQTLPTSVGDISAGYMYVGEFDLQGDEGDETCHVRIWEPATKPFANGQWPLQDTYFYEPYIMIAGVTYDTRQIGGRRRRYGADDEARPIIAMDPGWLDFTPSRDEIKDNEAFRAVMRAIERTVRKLDHGASVRKWLEDGKTDALLAMLRHSMSVSHPWPYTTKRKAQVHMVYLDRANDSLRISNIYGENESHVPLSVIEGVHSHALDLLDTNNSVKGLHVLSVKTVNVKGSCSMTLDDESLTKSNMRRTVDATMASDTQTLTTQEIADMALADDKRPFVLVRDAKGVEDVCAILRHETDMRRHVTGSETPKTGALYVIAMHDATMPPAVGALKSVTNADITFDEYEAICANQRALRASRRRTGMRSAKIDPATWSDVRPLASAELVELTPAEVASVLSSGYHGLHANAGLPLMKKRTLVSTSPSRLADTYGSDSSRLLVAVHDKARLIKESSSKVFALLVAVSRLRSAEPDLIPDDVDTLVIIDGTKVTNAQMQALAISGATFLCDRRARVKRRVVDTVDERTDKLRIDDENFSFEIDADVAFADDVETRTRWACLSKMEDTQLAAAATLLDLMGDHADAQTTSVLVKPLETLFAKRANNTGYGSTPWFDPVTRTTVAPQFSKLAIRDTTTDTTKYENAVSMANEIYAIMATGMSAGSYRRMPRTEDKDVARLARELGPAIAGMASRHIQAQGGAAQ